VYFLVFRLLSHHFDTINHVDVLNGVVVINYFNEPTVVETMIGVQHARRGSLGVWVVLRIN
ncbi:hypothetical protein THOM_2666, partial [Trachipleistophora hominis]